jgi:putative transposase
MTSERVIRVLDPVKAGRPWPMRIRADNGPEFVAEAWAEWGERNGVLRHFIPKGSPQANRLIERFNRSFREDILDCYLFESLDEVRDVAWEWLLEYNEERPHDSLDDLTRLEYRRQYEHNRRKSLQIDVQLTGEFTGAALFFLVRWSVVPAMA